MVQVTCEIIVGPYRFLRAHEVSLEQSWKAPGAQATIKLPGLKGLLAKRNPPISRGMPVQIYLGYDGKNRLEYEGYVTHVSPNIPFTIVCEDALFLLRGVDIVEKDAGRAKNFGVDKRASATTLKEVLDLIRERVPAIKVVQQANLEMKFTGLRLDYNCATVLQKFADDYQLACYFRGTTLYVGYPYQVEELPDKMPIKYRLGNNVIDTKLEWYRADERKIRYKLVGIDPKTKTQIQINMGDADEEGEVRTLFYVDKDVESMKKKAEAEIAMYKVDGYDGSLTAFGVPYCQHGDLISFEDELFPERGGIYRVDATRVTSGINGFRREITLGRQFLGA